MEKIKKVFSLIVIIIFLCQNVSFGTLDGNSALRPPSHFSEPTEGFINRQNEKGLKLIDELIARKGKEIVFSLPSEPEKEYIVLIQEDFITAGIFRDPNEKSKYMLYVETTSSDKKEMVYPVGIASGINVDGDGIMNLEWISVLDYPSILEEIKKFRDEQCREGTSYNPVRLTTSTASRLTIGTRFPYKGLYEDRGL